MQEDFKIKIATAQKFHEENKLNLARKEYKKLLEQFPKNIDILYLLGTLEIQSNNFKNGTYYLLKAINLNPNVAPFYNNLAVAYTELSNFKDALFYVNNAITIKNNYYEAYNTKANIYFKQKKLDEAIDSYKKAISLNPKYFEAYNNLGVAYKEIKKFAKAEKSFKSALDINPNYLSALLNLGDKCSPSSETLDTLNISIFPLVLSFSG